MVSESSALFDESVRRAGERCRRTNDLLVRVADGDLHALAGLYDEFAQPVFMMASREVRDPGRSAEVTEAVFLRVWREACMFDPTRSSAWAWIYGLARASTGDGAGDRWSDPTD